MVKTSFSVAKHQATHTMRAGELCQVDMLIVRFCRGSRVVGHHIESQAVLSRRQADDQHQSQARGGHAENDYDEEARRLSGQLFE